MALQLEPMTSQRLFGSRGYAYDANSNRTQLTADSVTTPLVYAPGSNRLDSVGASPVQLDANGNTLYGRLFFFDLSEYSILNGSKKAVALLLVGFI